MRVEVRTAAGKVRGRVEDGVAVFRGVPFAAPPVGRDRFADPRPALAWAGVREATRFGPPPPQPGVPPGGDGWLTLAVWTPDPGRAGLPVVVWLSGGAYLHCDTADPYLDGAAVAAAGAVVVSVNYRTGVEGSPGSTARRTTGACWTKSRRCAGCTTPSAPSAGTPTTSRSWVSPPGRARSPLCW